MGNPQKSPTPAGGPVYQKKREPLVHRLLGFVCEQPTDLPAFRPPVLHVHREERVVRTDLTEYVLNDADKLSPPEQPRAGLD